MRKDIKKYAHSLIQRHRANKKSISWSRYDRLPLNASISLRKKLTKDEKNRIEEKWKSVIPVPISRGLNFFEGMKSLGDFNPNYLPSAFYFPYILNKLNNPVYKKLLCHKSLLQMIYSTGIKHPRTFVRSYGGILLDENYHPLLRQEAIRVIKKQNCKLLYKPAMDSMQGKGIQLYTNAKDIECLCNEIANGNLIYKGDFVIQEPVLQCIDTEQFNQTSLNCIRVTTFNINNQISVGSLAIKCGPSGAFVDNIGSGKKGVLVGIDMGGNLREYGFFGNGEKTLTHNGLEFKGKSILHFDRIINAALEMHKYVDVCRIIGWDLALDTQYDPVLIEGNVISPGIALEQMCSGPIFGDRTNEVIEFLRLNS